ncbi:MAG: GNAT family N-acetyltransferase [Verrucomicrobiota bacterium]
MKIEVRNARREEVEQLVAWAGEEGWNPSAHDADAYYRTSPESFFVAEEDGVMVGGISGVPYGETFGFIGLFIVEPGHRGHQVGVALGERALDHLMGRNVGIDGVDAKVKNYEHLGFQLAYRNIRFECPAQPLPPERCHPAPEHLEIVPAARIPFEDLVAYDTACFAAPRANFLRLWLEQPESEALAALVEGRLAGYGKIRRCRHGYKFCPLFADRPGVAESLYRELRAKMEPDQPSFLDVPEVNAAAMAMTRHYGMSPSFQCTRMYSGGDPGVPADRVYGVTTFELG